MMIKNMNLNCSLVAATVVMLALASWAAFAIEISAEEKLFRAETELGLSKEGLDLNETCGVSLDASIEWGGFPDDLVNSNYSVLGYCEAGLDAIGSLCGGENKKAYIASNVTSLHCSYDVAKSATIEINGGALTYYLEFEESNLTDKLKKSLLGTL